MSSCLAISFFSSGKFLKFFSISVLVFFVLEFSGCRSTPTNTGGDQNIYGFSTETVQKIDELSKQADKGDIFEGNAPAKIPTIGILKPEGSYLSADEQWIPDMIKSAMNNNFRKFASGRIMVMNIADEEALNNEITKSLSGSNDELSLTARMAARSLMTGKVIKIQGTTWFTLEFIVTDTETHQIIATYSQNHSDIELIEGIAVNKAVESLLKDLNVRLNDAGRYALYGVSNEADTALAKGLSAAESGQGLQAMNYLFNAASYNTTASQASAPLAVVQSRNLRELQGAGAIVMDFFQRQELWQNRLDDFNSFYDSHAPFELFYTSPTPTNMRGAGDNRAYDLHFKTGLRWNQNQISVMEKVLQEYILTGLYKNPPQDIQRWELRGLPDDSRLFKGPDNFIYNLIINVENERGEIIASSPIRLNASLYRYQDRIYADCVQEIDAVISNIKYIPDQITPQLNFRIVSINGVDIKTVGESGFIRVAQTQDRELPAIQSNSLPRGLLSSMEREIATARRQERAAATEAEKQRLAREKEEEKAAKERQLAAIKNPLRIGIGAYGGPILGTKTGTITANVELGSGAFDAEFGLIFYPGTSTDIFVKNQSDDFLNMGINIGINYSFVGLRWFLNLGPGLTIFLPYNKKGDSSEKEFIPNLQAKLDWRLSGVLYLRLGYRFDLYPEDLNPIFKDNSLKSLGKFYYAHNVLFGLQITSIRQ